MGSLRKLELNNEKDIKDTHVPDATERIVSVVEVIAEKQDKNSEVPIEINSEAEEEEGEKGEESNQRKQEKETEVIEQHIVEKSGVITKPFLERRT